MKHAPGSRSSLALFLGSSIVRPSRVTRCSTRMRAPDMHCIRGQVRVPDLRNNGDRHRSIFIHPARRDTGLRRHVRGWG